jgi:multidrug efflux pump subunit AcrB
MPCSTRHLTPSRISPTTLAELRTIQDWYLRYQLTKAEGIAEVASVGGFVQQYQVVVDPQKLQGYGLTLPQLTAAIRASNRDVGGRVVEMSETEYVVRGRGYLRAGRSARAPPSAAPSASAICASVSIPKVTRALSSASSFGATRSTSAVGRGSVHTWVTSPAASSSA